jgi:calcineurin-like phosphoesterase family protein
MDPFHRKFDGENTYFIADPHLQHKNLVFGESRWNDKSGCRPFESVLEMNTAIIGSCVNTLNKDSVLFVLGDILFGNKDNLEYWLSQIKCAEIHLIYGNHCDFIRKDTGLQKLFTTCDSYQEILCKGNNGHYTLCCLFHYPLKSWRDSGKGSYALTGHVHGNLPYSNNERGLDMDWNIWRKPMRFIEIDEILSKREFKKSGH